MLEIVERGRVLAFLHAESRQVYLALEFPPVERPILTPNPHLPPCPLRPALGTVHDHTRKVALVAFLLERAFYLFGNLARGLMKAKDIAFVEVRIGLRHALLKRLPKNAADQLRHRS